MILPRTTFKMTELLQKIADIIHDYREGEIESPRVDHVQRWVCQFDENVREPLLAEMTHVLKRTYFSKERFREILRRLALSKHLAGDSPKEFWRSANFLRIQKGGRSQRDILELFDGTLNGQLGFTTRECGSPVGPFIYLDDAIFTGSRVIEDVSSWLEAAAPQQAKVYVIAPVLYRAGVIYAHRRLSKKAREVGKKAEFSWERLAQLENLPCFLDSADVFAPTHIPDEEAVRDFVIGLEAAGHPPQLRSGSSTGKKEIFSSADGRHLLEQQFLVAGARIRQMRPGLTEVLRPLGYHKLHTLGFGATVVTYRNCPNTCPLAFWFGEPWYPLERQLEFTTDDN